MPFKCACFLQTFCFCFGLLVWNYVCCCKYLYCVYSSALWRLLFSHSDPFASLTFKWSYPVTISFLEPSFILVKVGVSAVIMRGNRVLMLIDAKHYVEALRLLLLFGIFACDQLWQQYLDNFVAGQLWHKAVLLQGAFCTAVTVCLH